MELEAGKLFFLCWLDLDESWSDDERRDVLDRTLPWSVACEGARPLASVVGKELELSYDAVTANSDEKSIMISINTLIDKQINVT